MYYCLIQGIYIQFFSFYLLDLETLYRQGLQQCVHQAMVSIMTQILNEKVTQALLDVIFRNLVKEDKVHCLLSI
jgi:hypothetical protein